MDIKMIKVSRKGGYCLTVLKNVLGFLDPNNLLLMPVLRSQQQWLKVFQRSLVRQGQVNLLQKEGEKKRIFFALRHENTIPGNFLWKGKVPLQCSGVGKELLQVPQLWPLLLSRLVLFLSPSFQGSCLDPAVVSALHGSAGNATPLHLENLSIHWVCLWAGSDQGMLRKVVSVPDSFSSGCWLVTLSVLQWARDWVSCPLLAYWLPACLCCIKHKVMNLKSKL